MKILQLRKNWHLRGKWLQPCWKDWLVFPGSALLASTAFIFSNLQTELSHSWGFSHFMSFGLSPCLKLKEAYLFPGTKFWFSFSDIIRKADTFLVHWEGHGRNADQPLHPPCCSHSWAHSRGSNKVSCVTESYCSTSSLAYHTERGKTRASPSIGVAQSNRLV